MWLKKNVTIERIPIEFIILFHSTDIYHLSFYTSPWKCKAVNIRDMKSHWFNHWIPSNDLGLPSCHNSHEVKHKDLVMVKATLFLCLCTPQTHTGNIQVKLRAIYDSTRGNGQHYTPTALLLGKETWVQTGWQKRCILEPVWLWCWRENSGNLRTNCPNHTQSLYRLGYFLHKNHSKLKKKK